MDGSRAVRNVGSCDQPTSSPSATNLRSNGTTVAKASSSWRNCADTAPAPDVRASAISWATSTKVRTARWGRILSGLSALHSLAVTQCNRCGLTATALDYFPSITSGSLRSRVSPKTETGFRAKTQSRKAEVIGPRLRPNETVKASRTSNHSPFAPWRLCACSTPEFRPSGQGHSSHVPVLVVDVAKVSTQGSFFQCRCTHQSRPNLTMEKVVVRCLKAHANG